MQQETADLILDIIKEVKDDVKEIKADVKKINGRVIDLETDRNSKEIFWNRFWKIIGYIGTIAGIVTVALKAFNVF